LYSPERKLLRPLAIPSRNRAPIVAIIGFGRYCYASATVISADNEYRRPPILSVPDDSEGIVKNLFELEWTQPMRCELFVILVIKDKSKNDLIQA
jgi:hypothetical protein